MDGGYRPRRRRHSHRRPSQGARLKLGEIDEATTSELFGGPADESVAPRAAVDIDLTVAENDQQPLPLLD
jgi:hypothetical protein